MQQTPNTPSNSNAWKNLPTSLLVSQSRLAEACTRFGTEFTTNVFTRYKYAPVNIRQAAESNAPTLLEVSNHYSREAVLMWLRFHIAETFAFLGIYDTASKQQVIHTAELIIDHEIFSQLNLDEFLQFLTRFKRGDYGKIYQSQRPNPQEFLVCLRPFWQELVEYRIRIAQREKQKQQEALQDKSQAISWEEHCRRNGISNKTNPLTTELYNL